MNVKDYFDEAAVQWDCHGGCDYEDLAHVLRVIDIRFSDSVLDVGCGTGILLPFLYPEVGATGSITACDVSAAMLEQARRKFGSRANIRFVNADIEKSSPVGSYQHIVMYNMFPHLYHPIMTVANLVGASLDEGGNLTIAHHPGRRFINEIHRQRCGNVHATTLSPARELAQSLQAVGMKVTHIEDTDRHYIVQVER
jgi:demethylmenaquinone methyltransferase/2-methoxy-6-polyprenyl-1,4-benzoquinol methylase